jgi:peptidoglycan hydrolase-like protein with peptidoglycan-binding domain
MKRLFVILSVGMLLAGWPMAGSSEARGSASRPVQVQDHEVMLQAQRQLKALGYNPGAIDGNFGPQTGAALREYQRAFRLPQTGLLDEATLRSLLPERYQATPAPAAVPNQEVIAQAQRQLKVMGYDPGVTDGNFGPQTEAALREYQRAYRLPQTGMLDEATLRSLLPERYQASPPPTGLSNREAMLQAQRQLKALGYNPGAIDGNFGPQTEAALREYQRAFRLPQTGRPDEATLRSLLPERFQASPAPVAVSNQEVTEQAQRQLKALGYDPGVTDGNFGPQTEAALREYQRAFRLPQTGMLDEATLRSLLPERFQASPLPTGLSNREAMLQAQRQLKALGYNPGSIDGNFGPQTEAALREYQRAYRLPQTGRLDEATLRSLLPERTQSSVR